MGCGRWLPIVENPGPIWLRAAASDSTQQRLRDAETHLWRGSLDSAAAIYMDLLENSGGAAHTHAFDGLGAMGENEFATARQAFSSAVQIDSHSPWPPYLMGLATIPDDAPNALDWFKEALNREANWGPALVASARWRVWRYQQPGWRAILRPLMATEAIATLTAVTEQLPDHPTAHFELGQFLDSDLSDPPSASPHYAEQLIVNPGFVQPAKNVFEIPTAASVAHTAPQPPDSQRSASYTLQRQADYQLWQGARDSAAAIYLVLLSDPGTRSERLLRTGLESMAGGDFAGAKRPFIEAGRLNVRSPWPPYLVGLSLYPADMPNSRMWFEEALNRSSDWGPALVARARWRVLRYQEPGWRVFLRPQLAIEAVAALRSVADLVADHPTINYELGQFLESDLSDLAAALASYQRQLVVNPKFSPTQKRIAEIEAALDGVDPSGDVDVEALLAGPESEAQAKDTSLAARTNRSAELELWRGTVDSAAAIYMALFPDTGTIVEREIRQGLMAMCRGDYASAREIFESSGRTNWRSPWPPYLLGLATLPDDTAQAKWGFDESLRRRWRWGPALLAKTRWLAWYSRVTSPLSFNKQWRQFDAVNSFETVLGRTPDHPTANFELGWFSDAGMGDYTTALHHYQDQLRVDKNFGPALERVAVDLIIGQRWEDARDLLYRAMFAEPPPWCGSCVPLALAATYVGDRQFERADELFAETLQHLDDHERELYDDVTGLMTEEENDRLARATEANRVELVNRFWDRLDSTPLTSINERRLEHYRRVWYARERYSWARTPWDTRGDIYIRYGEPDFAGVSSSPQIVTDPDVLEVRRRLTKQVHGPNAPSRQGLPLYPLPTERPGEGLGLGGDAAEAEWESWVYVDVAGGIEISFTDYRGQGDFDYAQPPASVTTSPQSIPSTYDVLALLDVAIPGLEQIDAVEVAIAETPEASFGVIEPLTLDYEVAEFRDENGHAELEVDYLIPLNELSFEPERGVQVADLQVGFALHDTAWREIDRQWERKIMFVDEVPGPDAPGFTSARLGLSPEPGDYTLSIQATDRRSGHAQVYRHALTISEFTPGELTMSDVRLASTIEPDTSGGKDVFSRSGLRMKLQPFQLFGVGQPVFVYLELYNLTKDRFGRTDYELEFAVRAVGGSPGVGALFDLFRRRREVGIGGRRRGIRGTEKTHLSFDTFNMSEGRYELMVTATDANSGALESRTVSFALVAQEP